MYLQRLRNYEIIIGNVILKKKKKKLVVSSNINRNNPIQEKKEDRVPEKEVIHLLFTYFQFKEVFLERRDEYQRRN